MISFERAQSLVLANCRASTTSVLPLETSLGYVLAEKFSTTSPLPRFDMSAVDGYAVRVEDIASASPKSPVRLSLRATIRAGDPPVASLKKNQCVKVLTGGAVPRGATVVVMQELTREKNGVVSFLQAGERGRGIRRKGEEFAKGVVVLKRGQLISPSVIGLLATLGYSNVRVFVKPRVAIVVTGNELRAPNDHLRPGEQYDSNSFTLSAALRGLGIEPVHIERAKDTRTAIRSALRRALKSADVVITSGGVSVGEFDLVKDELAELNVKNIFWGVSMRPGKPNYFGAVGKKRVFALPGNPVAVLVSFQLFIRPALLKMQGIEDGGLFTPRGILAVDCKRNPTRTDFIRATMMTDSTGRLRVTPTRGQESHMLGGMIHAECLIRVDAGKGIMKRGEVVECVIMRW